MPAPKRYVLIAALVLSACATDPGIARPTKVETSAEEAALAQAVVSRVNQERAAQGLQPLEASQPMSDLAWLHSKDMVVRGFFDHTNPDGQDPFARAKAAGIGFLAFGENIAKGQVTADAVVDAWMKSAPHRANILSAEYTEVGVGVVLVAAGDSDETAWTQVFRQP